MGRLGRYVIVGDLRSGGTSTVRLAKQLGPHGFARVVAIKELRVEQDADARAMLLDEARLSARIQHTNVVSTTDVVEEGDRIGIVMEYVRGATLSEMLARHAERGTRMPRA